MWLILTPHETAIMVAGNIINTLFIGVITATWLCTGKSVCTAIDIFMKFTRLTVLETVVQSADMKAL